MRLRAGALAAVLLVGVLPAWAQPQSERAIMVREAQMYVAPATNSQKLGTLARGREAGVLERSTIGGERWVQVIGRADGERMATGWILDRGMVLVETPQGDRIVFGEAVEAEAEASRRGGRRGAAQDAMRLYYRVAEYFPNSELAGEALYRAADIRWQLDRSEIQARPSARERDPILRPKIDEEWMKEVKRKFPNTRWAALADYHMIDNRLCGDWQGLPRCPERESEMYERYVRDHPQSPKAPEALYEAARRQAALVEIYRTNNDERRSAQARTKAIALAQQLAQQFPEHDQGKRGARLRFLLEQNVRTYGTAIE